MSKIDELQENMSEEAKTLLNNLLVTRHPNGKHVVSAPALAQLLRTTCHCEISPDAVWRYRSKMATV